MVIKTKKYNLPKGTYVKIGFKSLMRAKWWVLPLLLIPIVVAFWFHYKKWGIFAVVVFFGYILFRFLQVYAVTLIEGNKMLFERFSYQISSKHIIMQISSKQGMTIGWHQIKKVEKSKKSFTLFMGVVQFIHLPKRIFNNPQERRFLKMLLKRKNLLK